MNIDQDQLNFQNPNLKPAKSFNNRKSSNKMQPYSKEFIKTKLKAFEIYKQFYPVQEKQNLYNISKTPCIGFYVMKGYSQKLNDFKQSKQQKRQSKSKSSDKILYNMVKKYFDRKEQLNLKQINTLPKIKQSIMVLTASNRTSLNLKHPKKSYRFCTQYQNTILPPRVTQNIQYSHLI